MECVQSFLQIVDKCIGSNPASFCLFSFFSHDKYSTNLTINDKSIDSVLGTRTQGGRMVGTDESTELWRHSEAFFGGNLENFPPN